MKLKGITGKTRNTYTFHVTRVQVIINKTFFEAMGSPKFVKFAYDEDEKIVAVAPASSFDDGARAINPNNRALCSTPLCNILCSFAEVTAPTTFQVKRIEDGWYICSPVVKE